MGRARQLRRQKCHAPQTASIQAEIRRQARQLALHLLARPQLVRPRNANSDPLVFLPRVDILDDPSSSRMVAIFELPGVRRDQISVSISQGIVHVRGRRLRPGTTGNGPRANCVDSPSARVRYPVQEMRYGEFGRGVKLPAGIEDGDLTKSLHDGLLTVTWPRQPKASPNVPPGEDESKDCVKP